LSRIPWLYNAGVVIRVIRVRYGAGQVGLGLTVQREALARFAATRGSADTGTLWEKVKDEWKEYSEIDGGASYRTGGVEPQYRGKGFNFSQWYARYDWVSNKGYENFSSWIG
jgi:hypothetical protein